MFAPSISKNCFCSMELEWCFSSFLLSGSGLLCLSFLDASLQMLQASRFARCFKGRSSLQVPQKCLRAAEAGRAHRASRALCSSSLELRLEGQSQGQEEGRARGSSCHHPWAVPSLSQLCPSPVPALSQPCPISVPALSQPCPPAVWCFLCGCPAPSVL